MWSFDVSGAKIACKTGKRKLKCSGEATGCSRCVKQSLACQYSIQKQMGRPKKRVREDEDVGAPGIIETESWTNMHNNQYSFDAGNNTAVASDAVQHCPPPVFPPMDRTPGLFPDLLSANNEHNHYWQTDQLTSVPATATPWPDFSSVSAASSSLSAMPSNFPDMQAYPLSPPNSNPPDTSAQCTCLSYLYLCLSHLSSLSPFPVSQHTLCSLFIAAKTARNVIRCEICPKRFATGMQNVMFLGTLLNVVADTWLRVSQTNAEELGRQAAPAPYAASLMQSSNPLDGWRIWLRQTVRGAVIGGPIDEPGRCQCSDSPDLLSLIKEMEERQRNWHSSETSHPLYQSQQPHCANGQSPTHGSFDVNRSPNYSDGADAQRDACNERDLLCLRIVGSARNVISKFNFEPYEYPDGVVS